MKLLTVPTTHEVVEDLIKVSFQSKIKKRKKGHLNTLRRHHHGDYHCRDIPMKFRYLFIKLSIRCVLRRIEEILNEMSKKKKRR